MSLLLCLTNPTFHVSIIHNKKVDRGSGGKLAARERIGNWEHNKKKVDDYQR